MPLYPNLTHISRSEPRIGFFQRWLNSHPRGRNFLDRRCKSTHETQRLAPSSSVPVEASYIDCLPSEWRIFGVNVVPDQCTETSGLTERRHALCDFFGTGRSTSAHELLKSCVKSVKAYIETLPEGWQEAEQWWRLPVSAHERDVDPSRWGNGSYKVTAQSAELTKRWLDGQIDDSSEIIWEPLLTTDEVKLRDLNQEAAAGEEDLILRSNSAAHNLLRRADALLKETNHGSSSNSRPHLVWCLQRYLQDENVPSQYLVPTSMTTEAEEIEVAERMVKRINGFRHDAPRFMVAYTWLRSKRVQHQVKVATERLLRVLAVLRGVEPGDIKVEDWDGWRSVATTMSTVLRVLDQGVLDMNYDLRAMGCLEVISRRRMIEWEDREGLSAEQKRE